MCSVCDFQYLEDEFERHISIVRIAGQISNGKYKEEGEIEF